MARPPQTQGERSQARSPRRGLASACVVLALGAAFVLAACAGPNLWTDLGSVSTGHSNRGRVRSPSRVPVRGRGYVMGQRWRERNFRYGTDELVEAVVRAAGRVRSRDRRAKLGIADFSSKKGGRSPYHKSHHSGRDVDLLFYTTDARGKPLAPANEMIKFDADGKPVVGRRQKDAYTTDGWELRRFDTKRNWQLVEALLTDPSIRVQWVFVSNALKFRMLRHARRKHRPTWIVEYASVVLRQPGDSAPHDDHFHVRVYCSRSDRFRGCLDRGAIWQHEKKTFKYFGPERYDPVAWRIFLAPRRMFL